MGGYRKKDPATGKAEKSTNSVAVTAGALVGGALLTVMFIRGGFRRFTF